jgi:multiple antibiotic resistance protein
MHDFWMCFVPLFVAVDAIGVLPIFHSLTRGLDSIHHRRILGQSVATAFVVGLAFLLVGPFVLRIVGVEVHDFMVAGGILLLLISLSDLLTGQKRQRMVDPMTIGAVPIGVPLITGPAVFTTSVLLSNEYGMFAAGASLLVNILIAGAVFSLAKPISRILGDAGSKTLSKVASLFLASIAVMLIRKGVIEIIRQAVE